LAADEIREMPWSPEEVHRGLEALSVHHREALTLFFLQDLSIEEMAGVLGVSEGTVKSRLFYGKRALRELLEASRNRP
jgi:RNA polymerase sigma-70 factor (ECF subfamily)